MSICLLRIINLVRSVEWGKVIPIEERPQEESENNISPSRADKGIKEARKTRTIMVSYIS